MKQGSHQKTEYFYLHEISRRVQRTEAESRELWELGFTTQWTQLSTKWQRKFWRCLVNAVDLSNRQKLQPSHPKCMPKGAKCWLSCLLSTHWIQVLLYHTPQIILQLVVRVAAFMLCVFYHNFKERKYSKHYEQCVRVTKEKRKKHWKLEEISLRSNWHDFWIGLILRPHTALHSEQSRRGFWHRGIRVAEIWTVP